MVRARRAASACPVHLYAYAGFPRIVNALGELMKVLESRRQRDTDTTMFNSSCWRLRVRPPLWGTKSDPLFTRGRTLRDV